MARIYPFNGVLYNMDTITEAAEVVAPPYDVISPEKQSALHDRHEKNVVRLILGHVHDDDTETENRHTRSAAFFNAWLEENTLVQDQTPALYLSTVDFPVEGTMVTRHGLICQVGLEPFENGVVLPHEQTFSGVKSERLGLMKMCKANFSQIFSIFSDQSSILDTLKKAVEGTVPDIDLVDDVNERHRLWRITDPEVVGFVQNAMADKCIYIADGHHRYETALNYREWLKETDPSFNDKSPANNIMMYLCSMEDPGLIIFPTHRLLNSAEGTRLSSLLKDAAAYFDIEEIPFSGQDDSSLETFRTSLADDRDALKIGVVMKGQDAYYVFALKPGAMEKLYGNSIPESLMKLDVTVLTNLIFVELLGLKQEALDKEKLITYTESDRHAAESVQNGNSDVAFILNPTKISQVKDIAESGQIMPRKTTYFYPKALTGLVFNKLTE